MIKMTDLVVAAVATAVLTLGFAAAQARDAKTKPADAPAEISTTATPEQLEQIGQATAERIVETPCAKKVKVVYAGYGEGDRACAAR